MANMEDRKNAFENKFAHDEELRFKATARRNKLLGLWAAEKLGKAGDAAAAYAREVIRKVRTDFDAAGVDQSDHQIRRTMDELLDQAIEAVRNA